MRSPFRLLAHYRECIAPQATPLSLPLRPLRQKHSLPRQRVPRSSRDARSPSSLHRASFDGLRGLCGVQKSEHILARQLLQIGVGRGGEYGIALAVTGEVVIVTREGQVELERRGLR